MKTSEFIYRKVALDEKLYAVMGAAFEKAKVAGIIPNPYADYSDNPKFLNASHGFKYDKFEIIGDNVELVGDMYVGCGETDYAHFTIPIEAFDNLDAWIKGRQDAIAQAAAEEAEQERIQREKEEAQEKENRRELLKKLQQEFGVESSAGK